MNPRLSLCIPCYNAAQRVEDTLLALVHQTAAPAAYEVLVIDNGSRDLEVLRALVHRCAAIRGNFRLIEEAASGLNHVRNRAARESAGEYVIFLDDDAVPLCTHVERLLAAIEEHHPDVIGGSLLAFPEVEIGRQFDHTFAGWWSLKHFGAKDRWLGPGEYFLGANIGARRELLLQHGFSPDLDRKGASLVGGGELWLGDKSFRRWHCAGAPVFHKVTDGRTKDEYLVRRIRYNLGAVNLGARELGRVGLLALYTPVKTACIQIVFRLRLFLKIVRYARQTIVKS